MAKLVTLKDKDGASIYPQTSIDVVFDRNGVPLEQVCDAFVKAEDLVEVTNPDILYEVQGNRVTSIDETSTNVQYPSAKAVYTAVHTALNNFAKIQGRTITINGVSIDIPNFEDGRGIAY